MDCQAINPLSKSIFFQDNSTIVNLAPELKLNIFINLPVQSLGSVLLTCKNFLHILFESDTSEHMLSLISRIQDITLDIKPQVNRKCIVIKFPLGFALVNLINNTLFFKQSKRDDYDKNCNNAINFVANKFLPNNFYIKIDEVSNKCLHFHGENDKIESLPVSSKLLRDIRQKRLPTNPSIDEQKAYNKFTQMNEFEITSKIGTIEYFSSESSEEIIEEDYEW